TLGEPKFTTTADGAKIAAYHAGPKDGETVILLASLGRSVSDFNALVSSLNSQGYHTISVNMRGVGKSKFAPKQSNLNLFDLAKDVHLAIMPDADREKPVILIGHAFGNRLARAYASAYPQSIKALVLVAAGGSQKLDPSQKVTQALGNSFEWKMWPPKRYREIQYAFFADTHKPPNSWKRGWYKKAAKLQVMASQTTPLPTWHAGDGKSPILVLQAANDRIAPAKTTSQVLLNDFPKRVQIVEIENAGHALLPEQAEAISDAVIQFLQHLQ
ncbi:MAG TPA: alpha/beta hydrolase, partial [Hellea balneolensis]|nr:alpha/beta hydrolase [Hellea balneolensis]